MTALKLSIQECELLLAAREADSVTTERCDGKGDEHDDAARSLTEKGLMRLLGTVGHYGKGRSRVRAKWSLTPEGHEAAHTAARRMSAEGFEGAIELLKGRK